MHRVVRRNARIVSPQVGLHRVHRTPRMQPHNLRHAADEEQEPGSDRQMHAEWPADWPNHPRHAPHQERLQNPLCEFDRDDAEPVPDAKRVASVCIHRRGAAPPRLPLMPDGGSKDKGRDAIHTDGTDGTVTIFAYSVREDWEKKLIEDSDKVKKHGHACSRLAFLTTAFFTATERDKAIGHARLAYGWTLELYGLERLRSMLATTHRQLVAQHPQIFCPPFFPVVAASRSRTRPTTS